MWTLTRTTRLSPAIEWKALALAVVLTGCSSGGDGEAGARAPSGSPPPSDDVDLVAQLSLNDRAVAENIANFWRCSASGRREPLGYLFERDTSRGIFITEFAGDTVAGALFDFSATSDDQVVLDFDDSDRVETLSSVRSSENGSRFDAVSSLWGDVICRVVPQQSMGGDLIDGAGNEGGDGDAEGEKGDGQLDDESDTPPPVPADGARHRLLVAERGPVVGVPEASLDDLLDVIFDRSGTLVYTGNYTSGLADRGSGLWHGTTEAVRLVRRSGDPLVGVPDTTRFESARALALASDGTLGYIARLSGAREDEVYVRETNDEARIIFKAGDRLQGFVEQRQVSRVAEGALSSAGVVARVEIEGAVGSWLWLWDGANHRVMAKSFTDPFEGIAPFLPGTRCRIHFNPGSVRQPSVFAITDDGAVVFQALLRADGGDLGPSPCPARTAVIRLEDGQYSPIVSDGDPVPGAEGTLFALSTLRSVTNDGTAIVHSVLSTPVPGVPNDIRWSLWRFAPSGERGLLALQGEEVRYDDVIDELPTNYRPTTFTDEIAFAHAEDGRLAALADLRRGSVMFGGAPRNGQPHGSIPTPGASTLQAVAYTRGSAPPGFASSRFFSSLAFPGFGPADGFIFHGVVDDVDLGPSVENAIWRADADGRPVTLLASGERLVGVCMPRELVLPAVAAVPLPVFHDDGGNVVMIVPLAGGADGVVLVPSDP